MVGNKNKEIDFYDVLVVREYTDVFPDELSRLPSDREIEFSIDLQLDTQPISVAPYRRIRAEME